jgi:hypothetical protein
VIRSSMHGRPHPFRSVRDLGPVLFVLFMRVRSSRTLFGRVAPTVAPKSPVMGTVRTLQGMARVRWRPPARRT